jgi:hypothetical protein
MNAKKISFASLALLSCLFADQSLAAVNSSTAHSTAAIATSAQEFQLLPILDVWGYTGKHTLGDGQVLVPLIGDQNKVFYVAAEGKVASKNNGWMAGGGLGYRQVIEQRIYGAYVTADQNNALDNRRFLVINPGIETLGMAWDFRVNGYFPTKRTWDEHHQFVDFEDHCGIYDDVRFEGHKQFDRQTLVTTDGKTIAGLGADAEIGRTIPVIDNLKAFVGGYYFNNKDAGHVGGASARVTWQATNNVGVEVIDTYDNQRHNTALLGIKVSLGGFGKDDVKKFGIAARLMDPIEHNIATAANGYTVPMRQDTKIRYHKFGAEILVHDNIWFFKQGATTGTSGTSVPAAAGDGTFENPFIGFNQPNVTVVNNSYGSIGGIKDKYPLLYFAPGTYSLVGQDFPTNGRFSLPLGWGMYGRNAGYNAPAFGDERALFNGGIDIMPATTLKQDDSDNSAFVTTLNSIHVFDDQANAYDILHNNPSNAAVYIKNAGNVVIKNSDIINDVALNDSAAVGMFVENSTVNFEQLDCRSVGETTVEGINRGNGYFTNEYGIFSFAGQLANTNASSSVKSSETTTINFNNGNNTVSGKYLGNDVYGTATGIYAYSNATTDTDSTININFIAGNNTINSSAAEHGNETVISSSAYSSADYPNANVNAKINISFNGGTNTITGNSGNIAYGISSSNEFLFGSNSSGTATAITDINFNGGKNTININTTGGYAYGIYSYGNLYTNGSNDAVTLKSNISFNGGDNSISASAVYTAGDIYLSIGSRAYSTNNVSSINANINFNGGNNTLTSSSNEGTYGIYVNSYVTAIGGGSAMNETNINFNGGNNTIFANGNDIAYGIYSETLNNNFGVGGIPTNMTNINFNGGKNTITANGTNNAYGIDSDVQADVVAGQTQGDITTNINFKGGDNTITATAGNTGTAYGILINTHQVNAGIAAAAINFFNAADSKVKFVVNAGVNRYGILTNNTLGGIITINKTESDILNYAQFTTSDIINPDIKGAAVVHNGYSWAGLWNVN